MDNFLPTLRCLSLKSNILKILRFDIQLPIHYIWSNCLLIAISDKFLSARKRCLIEDVVSGCTE